MTIHSLKNIIKKIFPVTHNIRYDNQTFQIMKIVLEADSTFVDVGCHKGEVLDHALKCSPNGLHFAFEPIPDLFSELELKLSVLTAKLESQTESTETQNNDIEDNVIINNSVTEDNDTSS